MLEYGLPWLAQRLFGLLLPLLSKLTLETSEHAFFFFSLSHFQAKLRKTSRLWVVPNDARPQIVGATLDRPDVDACRSATNPSAKHEI